MGVYMTDDLAVLDKKIALERVAGNEKLADDLLAMLVKELPNYKNSIREEFEKGNKKALRKTIHKIHGGLRYLGAPALMAIISATDNDLFEMKSKQLEISINKIFEEIDRLLEQKTY